MPFQYVLRGGVSAAETGLAATSQGLRLSARGLEATRQGFEASKRGVDVFVADPLLVTSAPRATEVALTTAPVVTGLTRDQRRDTSSAERERRGEQLRSAFADLGPTFVKLGQTLSVRPDLVPEEYVDALEKLQDQVPPAPWDRIEGVIEDELGPVDEVFDDFDREPLSGASLGQVYRAELDGETVAVKVRRPDIETRIQRDLRLVESAVPVVSAFLDDGRAFTLETIVDQFGDTIREELDYEREAEMMQRIRANFADDDRVAVPGVVDSHSSERVLTMEFVDGTKVSDHGALEAMAIDRADLANRLREVYLQMTLVDGAFHADPHPGNVAVQPDGTIVLYDFGMSGTIDPDVRAGIVDFFAAITDGDVEGILETLVDLGTLDPAVAGTDDEALTELVGRFVECTQAGEFDAQEFESLADDLEEAFYEMPFRLPPGLTLVLRVMAITDGVANTLDPEHDFFAVVEDVLADPDLAETDAAGAAIEP